MMLTQALQYSMRGKDSFRRLLLLVLVQLLPIVGQLLLLGYGFDIVCAVYAGQTDLPPIRWQAALANGCRFLLAGLGYLLPILITIGIVVGTLIRANTVGSTRSFGHQDVPSILVAIGLPLLVFLLGAVFMKRGASPSAQPSHARRSGLSFFLSGLLPVFVMILVTVTLSTLVSLSGVQTGKPNGLSVLLFLLLALLLSLIGIVLSIGGVRYALEKKGLLAPMANAKLLLKNPALTGLLLLNVILLGAVAVLTTTVGLMLFILPGLFAFVICSLAFWYLFAQYSRSAEIFPSGFALTTNTPLLV